MIYITLYYSKSTHSVLGGFLLRVCLQSGREAPHNDQYRTRASCQVQHPRRVNTCAACCSTQSRRRSPHARRPTTTRSGHARAAAVTALDRSPSGVSGQSGCAWPLLTPSSCAFRILRFSGALADCLHSCVILGGVRAASYRTSCCRDHVATCYLLLCVEERKGCALPLSLFR